MVFFLLWPVFDGSNIPSRPIALVQQAHWSVLSSSVDPIVEFSAQLWWYLSYNQPEKTWVILDFLNLGIFNTKLRKPEIDIFGRIHQFLCSEKNGITLIAEVKNKGRILQKTLLKCGFKIYKLLVIMTGIQYIAWIDPSWHFWRKK